MYEYSVIRVGIHSIGFETLTLSSLFRAFTAT